VVELRESSRGSRRGCSCEERTGCESRFHDEPRHRRRAIYRRVQRDSRRLSRRRGERHHPGGVPKRGQRPSQGRIRRK
ncbi:unnamed protein product, partial [Ectocarpus sp. 12 AP-2014]